MVNPDYLRQLSIFDPADFENRSVSVVGAGATGSYVALLLAQIGITNMTVWDFDKIEDHNLPNQMFFLEHVGLQKVDALKDIIIKKCGFEIKTRNEKVVDQKDVRAKYVFLLTDTMSSRKEIFENILKGSMNTDLVIETRMDSDNGRVYAFNPNSPAQVKDWESTLYTDEEASESLCGASVSIAPTVSLIASYAVWKLIQHFDVEYGPNRTKEKGKEEDIENEIVFQVGPENLFKRRFKTL